MQFFYYYQILNRLLEEKVLNRVKKLKQKVEKSNLKGTDFSSYNIRRIKFLKYTLRESKFINAMAGITPLIKIGVITALLLLSILGGIILSFSSRGIGLLLSDPKYLVELGWITSAFIVFSFLVFLIKVEYRTTLIFSIILFASFFILVFAFSQETQSSIIKVASIFIGCIAFIGVLVGFSVLVKMSVILEILTGTAWTQALISACDIIAILLGIACGNFIFFQTPEQLVSSVLVSLPSLPIIFYVREKALAGDPKYLFFRVLAINLCAMIGTSFEKADLTDADFTGAILGNTNFTKANLTRTCWKNARNLHKARVEGTYLENEKIRQLLVTGDGRDQNFDGLDLRGCNLRNADLSDASFINAKLSEATLEGANLTRAKLAKAQLYGTNLKNAILTGACIQDWAISLDTQLEGIKCEYVYMRLESKEDPDPWRKPDNRNETFKDGDFTDFIAPIIKTQKLYQTQNIDLRIVAENYTILDIFHHQGVDPSASAIAFQKLIEKYPEAGLKVLSMEGRGNEKIHFQAQVTDEVNRSMLSQEYSTIYNQIKSGTYSDLQAFLAAVAEKDQQILRFQELLENAIQQPKFYVETYQETRGNITISSVQGNISGVVGGDLTGTVDVSQGDTEISGDRNIEINKGDYRETSVNDQGSYIEGDAHNNSKPEES